MKPPDPYGAKACGNCQAFGHNVRRCPKPLTDCRPATLAGFVDALREILDLDPIGSEHRGERRKARGV